MPESATPRCVHRNVRRAALQLVRRNLSGKLGFHHLQRLRRVKPRGSVARKGLAGHAQKTASEQIDLLQGSGR